MKRVDLNAYIIKQYYNDEIPGYSSKLNGEWYFKLKDYFGNKALRLRTDMGERIIYVDDNNHLELANAIQATLLDLDNIVKREKDIAEYCINNKWTRSGT